MTVLILLSYPAAPLPSWTYSWILERRNCYCTYECFKYFRSSDKAIHTCNQTPLAQYSTTLAESILCFVSVPYNNNCASLEFPFALQISGIPESALYGQNQESLFSSSTRRGLFALYCPHRESSVTTLAVFRFPVRDWNAPLFFQSLQDYSQSPLRASFLPIAVIPLSAVVSRRSSVSITCPTGCLWVVCASILHSICIWLKNCQWMHM